MAELQEWAAVVYNEGLDDYETHARVTGVHLPDAVENETEEREAAERAEEAKEDERRERALDAIPAYKPSQGFTILSTLP